MTTDSSALTDTQLAPRRSRGLFRDAVRRLLASWNGRVGLIVVGFIFLVAVGAPIVSPYDPSTDSNLDESRQPPSSRASLRHRPAGSRYAAPHRARRAHFADGRPGGRGAAPARWASPWACCRAIWAAGRYRHHAGDGCAAGLPRHPAGDRHRRGARARAAEYDARGSGGGHPRLCARHALDGALVARARVRPGRAHGGHTRPAHHVPAISSRTACRP